MRTILNSEIRKERCNAAALGAYNASVGSGGSDESAININIGKHDPIIISQAKQKILQFQNKYRNDEKKGYVHNINEENYVRDRVHSEIDRLNKSLKNNNTDTMFNYKAVKEGVKIYESFLNDERNITRVKLPRPRGWKGRW